MWRRQTFCCRPVCPMLCARVLGGRNTVDETWRAAITLNLSPAPARCSLLSLTLTVEGGFRNSRVDRERSCCCCSPAPCPHSRGCTGPRRWMAWVWLGTGAEAKRRIARKFKPNIYIYNLTYHSWEVYIYIYHHHHQKAFRNKSHTSHGHRPGLKRNKSKGKRLTIN